MKKFLTRKTATLTVFVLMVALIVGIIGTCNTNSVNAAIPESDDIVIAHITDVHYFPFEYCNLDNPKDTDTDFYKKSCTDTKLIRESGTLLSATINNILAQKPDYLIVSGDLTSNGELQAHYDVANALRYLQEKMRKIEGKENFQIFVIPGNHDLYNINASKYTADGKRVWDKEELFTDAETFAKIYAGLGYPNIDTYENAEDLKTQFISHDEKFGLIKNYVKSNNANNINFDYYFNHEYKVGEEIEKIGFPRGADKAINCLSYTAYIDDINYAFTCIDGTERNVDNTYGFVQITGGRVTEQCLAWLANEMQSAREQNYTIVGTSHFNVLPHYSMEENLTKDFTFYNWENVAYELADNVGVRYIFTGHMHASDRAQFTTFMGNTITDFETGSTVSLKAPARYVTISRRMIDDKLHEDLTSKVIPVESLENVQSFFINEPTTFKDNPEMFKFQDVTDLTETIGHEIYDILIDRFIHGFINEDAVLKLQNLLADVIPENYVDFLPEGATDIIGKNLPSKEGLLKIINYLIDDVFNNLDYKIKDVQYDNLIDMVQALLKAKVESDKELIDNPDGQKGIINIVVYTDGTEAYTLGDVVIKFYKQHLMGGEVQSVEELDAEIKALSENLLTEDLEKNIVKKLIDTVLEPLLYDDGALLPQIINHKFEIKNTYFDETITDEAEIAKRLSESDTEKLKFIIGLASLAGVDINENEICINKILNSPLIIGVIQGLLDIDLTYTNIIDVAKDFLDKYLTTSFYTGIGGMIDDIVKSWAVDDSFDGITSYLDEDGKMIEKIYEVDNGLGMGTDIDGKKFGTAYDGKLYPGKRTYENGGLPSHATATFGDDPTTSVNIQFMTDRRIDGLVIYRKAGETEWTVVKKELITKKTEAYPYPLIDLGLIATYTPVYSNKDAKIKYTLDNYESVQDSVKFVNIYSVTLAGLEANTEYEYQLVGIYAEEEMENDEFPTDVKSFKTALPEGSEEAFDVLAMTDVQAMLKSSYEKALENFNSVESDYDFIINCGDVVDNGKNFKQWGFSQNILSSIWGNSLTVVSAGNHEDSDGVLDFYYNFGNVPEQNTETGIYYSFNYGNVHFTVLNTNDYDANGLGQKQLAWLKQDLENANNNDKTKWNVIVMHKGLYSAGSHSYDTEVIAMREQLSILFYENDVDLVLQGHDHVYNTTGFLDKFGNTVNVRQENADKENGVIVKQPKGIMYITLGTMGDKYYEYRENKYVTPKNSDTMTIEEQLTESTYSILTFDGDKLIVTNYAIGNDDFPVSLTIDKGAEITEGTEVDLNSIKLAGYEIKEGSNVLINNCFSFNDIMISRNDFGSDVKVKLYNKYDSETKEMKYAKSIAIELLPENSDLEKAVIIKCNIKKLGGDIMVNGERYLFGDTITLPEGTKNADIKYTFNIADICFENTELHPGLNQVKVKLTEGDTVYEQNILINVLGEAEKSNTTAIIITVVVCVVVAAVIITIVVLNKRKKKATK